MKSWKCPNCYRSKETDDDVVMVVCKCCQVKMEAVEDGN